MTDPGQPPEARAETTRQALAAFLDFLARLVAAEVFGAAAAAAVPALPDPPPEGGSPSTPPPA